MIIDNFYTREKEFVKKLKEQKSLWEWSMHPHAAEDILFAEIMNNKYGSDEPIVCASYYCGATPFTEREVDDLLFINSGLFTYDGWESDVVEFVVGLLMKGNGANVYADLKEVVDKKKFNVFFRKKCKEVCAVAIDSKVGAIKNRKDDLSESLYRFMEGVKDLSKSIKDGADNPDARRRIEFYKSQIEPTLDKFLKEYDKYENFTVRLTERLDWDNLMQTSNLSPEYLERRKPLWIKEANIHR